MRPLLTALRLIWSAAPWAMTRGAVLSVVVLVMGAALLGLSGWFITATGLAGLAGIGIAFDVFRPSAGIRLLALGRAGARYAERLLTHDATLQALAALRVDLLRRYAALPYGAVQRLRSSLALNRITTDVDALDGLVLRLVLPLAAGLATHALAFVVLRWLTDPALALTILAGYVLGAAAILVRLGFRSFVPSEASERASQALKRSTVDLLRGQTDIAMHGGMGAALDRVASLDGEARSALAALDRADREAGIALGVLGSALCGAVLLLAGHLVESGLDPALAALAFFVTLALGETLAPLRRGVAEIGRMRDSAARVMGEQAPLPDAPRPDGSADGVGLRVAGLGYTRPGAAAPLLEGVSFSVGPGETVALTGPSGRGKSTLLAIIAGLLPPGEGDVSLAGRAVQDWPEAALRGRLTLLPQRSALIAGTVFENLALARASLSEDEAWDALAAAGLDDTVRARGGLGARLGEGGRGLSGGEARRLALARVLLRRPDILLLDEPTEGLDDARARRVLAGIRAFLPDAAILTASHRQAETDWADRRVAL
jgi:ATP-binding cassette subfamily C protein CydC